jgi:hypothetical protein
MVLVIDDQSMVWYMFDTVAIALWFGNNQSLKFKKSICFNMISLPGIIPSNIPMKIQKIFGCTAKPQQSENKIKNKCVLEEGNYK